MKKLAVTLLILLSVIVFSHCGKDPLPPPTPIPGPGPTPPPPPPPPPPPVETIFEVRGDKILVKGVMKVNPKASIAEMQAAVKSAVYNLEN